MKKFVSIMLVLTMVLSMATVAFAEEQDLSQVLDKGTKFTKAYDVKNGEAPAETFNFNVAFESYKDNEGNVVETNKYPTVTLGSAAFANNMVAADEAYTADASVAITNYADCGLGVYTYKITEKAGTTAGVGYVAEPVYLVVTVLYNQDSAKHYVAAIHYETASGEKVGNTTNEYDAGKLTVTKNIAGNAADMKKEFNFTIVLTPAAGDAFAANQNVIDNEGATVVKNENGTWTVTVALGHQESINITNIPAGTTYTVAEDAEKYTSSNDTVADGSIAGGDEDKSIWTNTLGTTVDTGITMDTIPYIVVLAVAVMGLVAVVANKRRAAEF